MNISVQASTYNYKTHKNVTNKKTIILKIPQFTKTECSFVCKGKCTLSVFMHASNAHYFSKSHKIHYTNMINNNNTYKSTFVCKKIEKGKYNKYNLQAP